MLLRVGHDGGDGGGGKEERGYGSLRLLLGERALGQAVQAAATPQLWHRLVCVPFWVCQVPPRVAHVITLRTAIDGFFFSSTSRLRPTRFFLLSSSFYLYHSYHTMEDASSSTHHEGMTSRD